MSSGLGELAAFSTAVTWGISNQIQSSVGRMLGPTYMNLLRMPYLVLLLGVMCLVMGVETSLGSRELWFIALSGATGAFLCDFLLYKAIYILGPPVAVLLLSTSTVFTAVFGWLALGENLPLQAALGIAVTLAGILWVMTEHGGSTLLPGQKIPKGKRLVGGVLLACGAAISISAGFILLKMGMHAETSPLWATFIRLATAATLFWGIGLFGGWIPAAVRQAREHPAAFLTLLLSSLFGASGAWLASIAVGLAPVGVVATLIGLQPVMVTIVGAAWYRKKPSPRVISGILTAFAGTAMVWLR